MVGSEKVLADIGDGSIDLTPSLGLMGPEDTKQEAAMLSQSQQGLVVEYITVRFSPVTALPMRSQKISVGTPPATANL